MQHTSANAVSSLGRRPWTTSERADAERVGQALSYCLAERSVNFLYNFFRPVTFEVQLGKPAAGMTVTPKRVNVVVCASPEWKEEVFDQGIATPEGILVLGAEGCELGEPYLGLPHPGPDADVRCWMVKALEPVASSEEPQEQREMMRDALEDGADYYGLIMPVRTAWVVARAGSVAISFANPLAAYRQCERQVGEAPGVEHPDERLSGPLASGEWARACVPRRRRSQ